MALQNTSAGAKIASVAKTGGRLWFIGIGGVHMSAMALWAARRGFSVAGSDRSANERTDALRTAGISVHFGHNAARVVGADAVIYTLAISSENPEYTAAKRLGIPTFSRADFLSYMMMEYQNRIAVAGSHGKSTVTAMLAEIFLCAGRDPTVFCGAPLCRRGSTMLLGGGRDFIFEACEYQDSFLCFSPTVAAILNVEMDHVDYFQSLQSLQSSFGAFAQKAETVVYNAEDARACACVGSGVGFGIQKGDFSTRSLAFCEGKGRFCVKMPDGTQSSEIALRVVGEHNVSNALAAFAMAHACGIDAAAIATGLSSFRGAGRRMEYRGMIHGARVFDDYAHHPSEIRATLRAARQMMRGGRLIAVFQSHTYSRTAAFFAEICEALSLADRVLIAPIYPARETDTLGMSAARLAAGVGDVATAAAGFGEIAEMLLCELVPGDLAVVMGAGDIDRLFGEFSEKHFTL